MLHVVFVICLFCAFSSAFGDEITLLQDESVPIQGAMGSPQGYGAHVGSSVSTEVRPGNSDEMISLAYSDGSRWCMFIDNVGTQKHFLPLRSLRELKAFLANAPGDLSIETACPYEQVTESCTGTRHDLPEARSGVSRTVVGTDGRETTYRCTTTELGRCGTWVAADEAWCRSVASTADAAISCLALGCARELVREPCGLGWVALEAGGNGVKREVSGGLTRRISYECDASGQRRQFGRSFGGPLVQLHFGRSFGGPGERRGCGAWVRTADDGQCNGECRFNGQTIADGQNVTAYEAAAVPYGSQCVGQTRTCANGTLSGSYGYSTCSVSQTPSIAASETSFVCDIIAGRDVWQPSANDNHHRANLAGTDLGFFVPHSGDIFSFYGDTHAFIGAPTGAFRGSGALLSGSA